jgi:ubiquinone/menaquinone biosynthesis C-methylase UbiE
MTILQRLYLWACERLYAELAWSYDSVSWLVSFGAWDRWRTTALTYARGERILEIGFGTGSLLATLAAQARPVIGLELSPAMQRQAGRKLARLGLHVPRVQAPTQQMPFAGGTFDTILSTFPSGYIVDPATLRECARVLRQPTPTQPGGRLVVVMSVAAPQSLWSLIMRWLAPTDRSLATRADPLLARFAAAGLHATRVNDQQGATLVHLILAEPYLLPLDSPGAHAEELS